MSSKKALLLNSSFEVISLISEKRVLKLLFKGKVEVISTWNDNITISSGSFKYPAIVKLKKYVKINYSRSGFSRQAIIKRDRSICQYCSKKLSAAQITIDHVLPKVRGGANSFINCVVSCWICNNQKADRTPEEAGMILLRKPIHPSFSEYFYTADPQEHWHKDWDDFLIR